MYFRTYETADAVVAIACGSHRLREAFMEAVRLSDPALTHGGEDEWTEHYRSLRDQVEDRMRAKTSAEWMRTAANSFRVSMMGADWRSSLLRSSRRISAL